MATKTFKLIQNTGAGKNAGDDAEVLPAGKLTVVSVERGRAYRVVLENEHGSFISNAGASVHAAAVLARREGNSLRLKYEDGTELQLAGFYDEPGAVVDLGAGAGGKTLSAGDAAGTALTEGNALIYANGNDSVLMQMAQGDAALQGALTGYATGGSTAASTAGWSPAWLAGAAVGGLGLIAAVSGGGSDADTAVQPVTTTEPAPTTQLKVNFVAGPVIAGHQLQVKVYAADGSEIGSGPLGADGTLQLVLNGSYTGAVLVRVYDSGTQADYWDEATNAPRDLQIDMRAALVIPQSGNYSANVNVLTELAVRQLGLAGGDGTATVVMGNLSAQEIQAANQQIATSVGLTQPLVEGAAPVAIVQDNGQAEGNANSYGRLLAALSGLEQANGDTNSVLAALMTSLAQGGTSADLSGQVLAGAAAFGNASLLADVQQSLAAGNQSPYAAAFSTIIAGADGQANGNAQVTQTQYETVGVVNLDNVSTRLLNDSIDRKTAFAVNTRAEIQALADIATRIVGVAAGTSVNPALTAADFEAIGVSKVSNQNLAVLLQRIAASADDASAVDTLAKLQALADAPLPTAPVAGLAQDTGVSASDGITRNRIVNVSGLEKNASFEYSVNGGVTWATGSGSSFGLDAGSYTAGQVQVRQIDAAGITGTAVTRLGAMTVDTIVPATPVATLAADTGVSSTDGITRNGVVNVDGLEDGASYEYSTDAGATWRAGTGSNFTLAAGNYKAEQVQVRQTDAAGNTGSASTRLGTLTVDTTAPAAPGAAFVADTGVSSTDGITRNGTVNVIGLETGAHFEYSSDAGATWTAGTGSSFTLDAGSYDAGQLQVRQIDAAGNTGSAATSPSPFTVDTAAPAAPVATLAADTGASSTDRITRNGLINVGGLEAGAQFEYSVDTGATWVAGTGSSFTLAAGNYEAEQVQVRQIDAAGNTGPAATRLDSVAVDSTAPAAPAAALTTDTGASSTDGITRNGTIDVQGLEADASYEYSTDAGATWVAGTGSSFALAAGDYKAEQVQVRQTDAAGNTSTDVTRLEAITVDTTVPAAATVARPEDTGVSATDGITNDGVVKVTGLENGASFEYSTDAGESWTPATGSSFTLADGSYKAGQIQVRQIDVAGNAATDVVSPEAITVDTIVPTAPTAKLAEDTGISATDGITRKGLVNVTGLEKGASFEYSIDSGANWANGDSNSNSNSFKLAPGIYTAGQVQVRQTDVAGNTATVVTRLETITVDTTSPTAPTASLAKDTGSNSIDGLSRGGLVDVSGLEDGASFEYSTDAGATWSSGNGSSFVLATGNYQAEQVQVRQLDAAGNTGSGFNSLGAVTVDTLAVSVELAEDTGAIATDGITQNGTVTVTGLGDGASFEYSIDSGVTFMSGTGNSFTLADAGYKAGQVQVRQIDAAGNTATAVTRLKAITVDTTAPAAPAATLAEDTGTLATDGITRNGTIDVKGLEADASYEYSIDAGTTWVAGSESSFTLAAGSYAAEQVQVRQTDVAGNTPAEVTKLQAITVDTTVPEAVTAILADDTGTSGTDGITRNGLIKVSGLDDGTSFEHSTDAGETWTNGTGSSFTLAADRYAKDQVQVRQTDVAGNTTTDVTKLQAITVDTTSPAAPAAKLAEDSGASVTDGITRNGLIDVTGLEEGASFEYSTDAGETWLPGKDSSFTLDAASYKAEHVLVRQTDVAGNTGTTVTRLDAITVDTTAPDAPIVELTGDTGTSSSDGITRNGSINVRSLEDGASFEYSTDSGATWTGEDGTSFKLEAGSYSTGQVQVRQVDAAGNTTIAVTRLEAITVDTLAPAAPEAKLAEDTGTSPTDGITRNGLVNVSGLEDGAVFEYTTDSGSNWTDGTGSSFVLATGSYASGQVQVRQTDVAGNTSAVVASLEAITVDTTAPAAHTAVLAEDTGASATDGVTRNGLVNVSGLEDGAIFEYTTDNGANWTVATGNSFTLATGSYTSGQVQMRQTDVAGNTTSPVTRLEAITVDTTPPAAATAALANDTGSSATDGITCNGTINVGGLEDGASFQYSTDSGSKWATGTGNSFTLAAGSYTSGQVLVRQIDVAGNAATDITRLEAITVDETAPAAHTAELAEDTGASATDGITRNGMVNVGGIEDGAHFDYTKDGGYNWTRGTGNGFTLAPGSYTAEQVQVLQTDVAGNTTAATTRFGAITVDTTAPAAVTADLAEDTGSSATDGITRNGTMKVGGLEDGGGFEYSTDSGSKWEAGTGNSLTLASGSYAVGQVQVRQIDRAGNASNDVTSVGAIMVDTTAPASPTAALAEDTGASANDGITRNGLVNMSGLENGASFDYTADSGFNWTTGAGSSFTLASGSYKAGQVQVRQTDVAGNTAAVATSLEAITVDVESPGAPTADLAKDTGASASDSITRNGTINVKGLETGATYQYSIDAAATWIHGSDSAFTLSEGSYAAGQVQVRQIDAAGNTGTDVASLGAITVDTVAPGAPAAALAETTGTIDSDGVIQYDLVNVSALEDGATFEYSSTAGGRTWVDGIGSSFTLTSGLYQAKQVQVRQLDAAGNASSEQSLEAMTIGTNRVDILNDGGIAQTLVGGPGSDLLIATAASVLYGGIGHDRFWIGGAMLSALVNPMGKGGNDGWLAKINGGAGVDTLSLRGVGLTLDLGALSGNDRLESIEQIDLISARKSTLRLSAADVLSLSETDVFAANGRHQLMVLRDDDVLDLVSPTKVVDWMQQENATFIGQSFEVWNSISSQVTVYVSHTGAP